MQQVYDLFKELGIGYEEYKHPAIYTVEEGKKYDRGIDAGKTKNLFLRNKKGNRHYLIIIESQKKVNVENLEHLLKENNLSFASPERLKKYLGLTPGSVSPFGLINDKEKEVTVVIDNNLMKYTKIAFHPNINTATLVITVKDFKKFLEWSKNTIISISL